MFIIVYKENRKGMCRFVVPPTRPRPLPESDACYKLWPTTCPHEGAPLSKKCLKKNSIECPWHARKLQPLLIINKDKETKILPSIDFAIKESSEFFEIRFRNKPKYYDNKPYKHFSFED